MSEHGKRTANDLGQECANTRLIAAAPCLLAAAKAVLDKEKLLTSGAAYLEYRALELAIAKGEGK